MLPVRFAPYSVFLNTLGGVDAWINQIQTLGIEGGITLFEESGGSQTDREFVASKEIAPTIPMETTDLSMLATIGMLGVSITPGSSTPGATIYAREIPNQAVPLAVGSNGHISMLVSDGELVPVKLSASNDEAAKLELMLHAILGTTATYSGATPVVLTGNTTITSGATGTSNIYTTGVVKFTPSSGPNSGTARLVKGVMSQTVDFGLKIRKESSDGEVYVSWVTIEKRYPYLDFVTADVELLTEIGDGVSASAFAMYFRAVAQNGQRVANATTSHVSISGTAGMVIPQKGDLKFQKSGTAAVRIVPSLNSSLLTISTAAAIPTS